MGLGVDQPEVTVSHGRRSGTDDRLDDLAQIVSAYNDVTEKLQRSHEALDAEVVRLQRELASTNAQLQRTKRLAALGEMAAGIAHEIRNPLAAIQLYARMVVEDLESFNAQGASEVGDQSQAVLLGTEENAGKILSAVRGLNGIVTDVLSFARDIHPKPREMAAEDLFRRAFEEHRPAIEALNVRIVLNACAAMVYADPDLLHQVLLNLIRNAVEAMTPNGGTLTLSARREYDQVALVVRDTGPGISEADVDRIFNPFVTTRSRGTGLGLAIVHRIIDAHGGTILVANDAGAVLTLSLPLPRQAAPQRTAKPLGVPA